MELVSDEDKKSQDDASPDPKEDTNDYEDIKPIEPEFTCGVILIDNLSGEGFQIIPLQNGKELRIATVDDIIGLIAKANVHLQSNLSASKIINELTKQRKMAAELKAAADRRSQQR